MAILTSCNRSGWSFSNVSLGSIVMWGMIAFRLAVFRSVKLNLGSTGRALTVEAAAAAAADVAAGRGGGGGGGPPPPILARTGNTS